MKKYDFDIEEIKKFIKPKEVANFVGRLREEKEHLEKRLADVNTVLKSLTEAPEVAKVLEALNKLGY